MARIMALFALLLANGSVLADWMGFSNTDEIAELSVMPGQITLNLRITDSSVPSESSLPIGSTGSLPPWLAMRLPSLQAKSGKPYASRLLSLELKAANPETSADDGGKAYYEAILAYPIEERMDGFVIIPPVESSRPIGLVTLHRGVPVSDLMPLKNPVTVSLDWNDPWRSRFDNPDFIRRHAEPSSYLYVESYEVRHELLLRLKDIKAWLDLGLANGHFVEDGEKEAVKKKVGEFLLARNPISIDDTHISPQLGRVEFVRFDQSGVVPVTGQGRLETETALVGVMLSYLTEQPAQNIRLQWDLFGENLETRQINLIVGKETFESYVNPKQPFFDWSLDESLNPVPAVEKPSDLIETMFLDTDQHRPLMTATRVITVIFMAFLVGFSVLLFKPRLIEQVHVQTWMGMLLILAVGALFHPFPASFAGKTGQVMASSDDGQTKIVLQSLLHNAYRAFQLYDEEKAYDRLSKSLDGDLLENIYLQQRKAIIQQSKGLSGEGQIERIEVLESHIHGEGQTPGVLVVSSRWLAHGTVSHWGHSHERHNLYQARLTLRKIKQAGWKIVGMEFLDGQRLGQGASS